MAGDALTIAAAKTTMMPVIAFGGAVLVSEFPCTCVFWVEYTMVYSRWRYRHVGMNVGVVDECAVCCAAWSWSFCWLVGSGKGGWAVMFAFVIRLDRTLHLIRVVVDRSDDVVEV